MHYELYDTTGARLLMSSAEQEEVWRVVREFLATGDPSYLTDLAIVLADEQGQKQLLVEGNALAARALAKTTITPVAA